MTTNNKSNGDLTVSVRLKNLLSELATSKELKAKSLISTIFGDCAAPYGGSVWIESLTAMLEPFGINERLVRTSLFRLVESEWLQSIRAGRKSYYQLAPLGASQTKLAESIIYHPNDSSWDGQWTLVFLVIKPVNVEARNQLEQELRWMGFGNVSNHVWAHPQVGSDAVLDRVKELDLLDKVICMRCANIQNEDKGFQVDDREMARRCMPIDGVQEQYRLFIERFQHFQGSVHALADEELLTLRLLLIDQYRKIALSDPSLPLELLPEIWDGAIAFKLTSDLYWQINQHSDRAFSILVNAAGVGLVDDFDQLFSTRFSAEVA